MSSREDVGKLDENLLGKVKKINFEEFFYNFRYPIFVLLLGAILVGLGVFFLKNDGLFNSDRIEVLSEASEAQDSDSELFVEIAGAIQKPGVYKFTSGSRVEDLLIASGGLSGEADRNWVEKVINRAAKLSDGQKVYIKSISEQSEVASAKNSGGDQSVSLPQGSSVNDLVNINDATLKELDALPGIGPVYGQSIIDHRPYSSVEDLVNSGALKKSTYEKIKDLVTVY